MKKIVVLFMLFCLLISCERKEPNFSEEMIEKLAHMNEDPELGLLPSRYLSFDLYVLTSNKEICKTNNHDLFFCYKKNYFEKFNSFESFLNAVLNQDFLLDRNLIKNSINSNLIKLNQKIEKEYAQLGFDKFLKKYSEQSYKENQIELKKSIIKSDEYSTISYILYLNRYDISFDDPHVTYHISKREDFF